MRTIVAFALFVSASLDVAAATLTTWMDNGPANNRVNLVVVGDGYTQAELNAGKYDSHVDKLLSYVFVSSLADPLPRYKNFFNTYSISVASNQSGPDQPGKPKDTALDSLLSGRLAYFQGKKAEQLVAATFEGTGIVPATHFGIINSNSYGGGGADGWATFTGGSAESREIAVHEFGHSFARVWDEYGGNASRQTTTHEPKYINVTSDPTGNKWSRWLGFDDPRGSNLDIGAFEGAAYYDYGYYRPSFDSKMRALGRHFDAVSREAFILKIYEHVDPLDAWMPNTDLVGGEMWVDVVDSSVIGLQWFVDGDLVPTATSETFSLTDYGFRRGTYDVMARAYDKVLDHSFQGGYLDLVRSNFSALEQSVAWSVSVTPEPSLLVLILPWLLVVCRELRRDRPSAVA